jgi:hypothetical protein
MVISNMCFFAALYLLKEIKGRWCEVMELGEPLDAFFHSQLSLVFYKVL